jgi:phosphoglycerol transferase MdoB-like AlkP superfamily enzyme
MKENTLTNKLKTFFSNFSWSGRTVSYILATLAIFISVEIFNSFIPYGTDDPNWSYTHFYRLADAALLALPIAFIRKKWFVISYNLIVSIYLLSNIWYFRYYYNIIPLSSFALIGNLKGLGPSIFNAIHANDFCIILPIILYCIYYLLIYSKKIIKKDYLIICGAMLFILVMIVPPHTFDKHRKKIFKVYRYWPKAGYHEFGLINYWIDQFSSFNGRRCSRNEIQSVDTFISTQEHINYAPIFLHNQNKNLILIIVESLSDWLINTEIDGHEITPNINRLITDTNCLYFNHVMTQVKDGRSSDGYQLYNTGLLPLRSGAAAQFYSANTFYSLPKALKQHNYHSLALICDDKTFWNQDALFHSYGYDTIYDKLGDDKNLFQTVPNILTKLPQPFISQIITISMHDALKTNIPSNLRNCSFKDEKIIDWTILAQHTDSCLGAFISSLKKDELYYNSIIVIVGDHNYTITRNIFEGRKNMTLEDCYIPLIIINSPVKTDCHKVIAQSDIYPSLLDLMGCENYPWRGFGESIFRNHSGCAVYYTGEVLGNTSDTKLINRKKESWQISDIILRSNYFNTHKLNKKS